MLVLRRCHDEEVIITTPDGSRIRVAVLGIVGADVRLGFDAPIEVTVNRREIQEIIDRGEVRGEAVAR